MSNSLQAALDAAKTSEIKQPEKPKATKQIKKKPVVANSGNSRKDTVLIAGHFSKDVSKQLRFIAIEEEKTNQELLAEALNLLFTKKGKKKISEL